MTDTNQASELYELCKKVYELTGWKQEPDISYLYKYWDNYDELCVISIEGAYDALVPAYTSDYLLEKLPGYIALTSTTWDDVHVYKKDSELDYQACACYQSNVKGKLIQKVADTPLKALLKLTIALSEAGELNG